MQRRQPLPRLWLMTDERQGETLWSAVERLPRGAGIVFRHYGLPQAQRAEMLKRLRRIAKRKELVLVAAGNARVSPFSTDGCHGRPARGAGHDIIHTASAHDLPEIRAAERSGANLIFLSPAFATRSHPGVRPLGPLRFMLLAKQARVPVIALGGMDAHRARRLGGSIYGWAAIDAWTSA